MPKLSAFLISVLLLALSSLGSVRSFAQAPQPSQPSSAAAMEQAIHDYLLAHPEVMLESIRNFDVHRKAVEQAQAQAKVRQNLSALRSNSPASSAATAAEPVTIVEFFDYRCGFCKKVQPTVAQLAARPGVRIIYKDLPILGPDSLLAAKAALAAEKQGGYARLHDALIGAAAPLTAGSIVEFATKAGLDAVLLKKDMESPEVNGAIQRNLALAEKLSIQATPTFVVGDQMISGALTPEAFDGLIKKAQAAPVVASATH